MGVDVREACLSVGWGLMQPRRFGPWLSARGEVARAVYWNFALWVRSLTEKIFSGYETKLPHTKGFHSSAHFVTVTGQSEFCVWDFEKGRLKKRHPQI